MFLGGEFAAPLFGKGFRLRACPTACPRSSRADERTFLGRNRRGQDHLPSPIPLPADLYYPKNTHRKS